MSLHELQEKSRKKDIIRKLNELVLLLKDEGGSSNTIETLNSSNSYQTTPMAFFEKAYSVVGRSSDVQHRMKELMCKKP